MDLEEKKIFIENEIKRISEEYKVPETRTALFAGKRLAYMGLCTKEEGLKMENFAINQLSDHIISIIESKELEEDFDYKNFFYEVDRDFMEDFAIIQLPKLSIWKEIEKENEGDCL